MSGVYRAKATRHMVSAWAVDVPLERKRKNTNRITMPMSALTAALLRVGGLSGRAAAPRPRLPAGLAAPSRGLLVRPRASTTPTAFPRCLERRLRFVWAMPLILRAEGALDQLTAGVDPAHRHVGREAGERRLGRAGHELGAGHVRVTAHGGDHLGGRGGAVGLDVRRPLDRAGVLERDAERPHRRKPLRPALADGGGDRSRVLEGGGRRQL